MSDRAPPPGFSGRPPNYNNMFNGAQGMNSAMQHGGMQQLQQDPHQQMPFADSARMWPMQPGQEQFRPQPGNPMGQQSHMTPQVSFLYIFSLLVVVAPVARKGAVGAFLTESSSHSLHGLRLISHLFTSFDPFCLVSTFIFVSDFHTLFTRPRANVLYAHALLDG
jgi:hypothetical protein